MRLQTRVPWWAGITLTLALLTACGRGRDSTSDRGNKGETGSKAVPDTASDPGSLVARRIVKAASLEEAIIATREAVTRGGLTISDFNGGTEAPSGPASPFIVLPPEAVLLASEARQHETTSRLTLYDLASMLADLGWPFAGEGMPADQLMGVLAEWVRRARAAPDDPINFTPLVLADMARRQIPAVDLSSDSTDPREVRLGFLEVQLFAAALTRGLAQPVKTGLSRNPRILFASYRPNAIPGPCDGAKEWFGANLPGGLAGAAVGWQVGKDLEQALLDAGLNAEKAGQVTKALDAIAAMMKVAKLAELYGSTSIVLEHASEMPAERPAPGQDKYASVRAKAGLAPEEYEAYRQSIKSAALATSVRNCLEAAGLPSWSDVSDAAADLDAWRVTWMLGRGSPKHAMHTRERNEWYAYGHRIMQIKRTSPTSGEATYTFKLTPEGSPGHPGNNLKGEVRVNAELGTSKPPGVGTITDAMLGPVGLVKALVDVGVGWFQTMVTQETYLDVPIIYHERGISILIEDENHVVLQFGEKGKHLFATKVAERSRHVYAGSIHLGEDSLWHGQMLVTVSGSYTAGDEKAAKALAQKYANIENMSLEQGFAAVADLIDDVPTCKGSYDGAQVFAVEGSFTSGTNGKDQVELAFIPVGPPEYYRSTAECPWPSGQSVGGFDVLPARLVRGEGTALVIDPPVMGQQRVYRTGSSMKDLYSSTVTTVGADFSTGDN